MGKLSLSMQTVIIPIVNSNADWFVSSEQMPEEIYSVLERARQEGGKIDLGALEKQAKSGVNDIFVLSPTFWRTHFGLELFQVFKIAGDFSSRHSRADNCFELSLWYADKYGHGRPNFFGYGNCYGGTTLFYELNGLQISAEEARKLERLAFSTPPNIRFARSDALYAEGVDVAPKPKKS